MDRRTLLLVALSGSVILTSAGFFLLRGNTNTRHLTMAASIQTLDELIRQELICTGEWNLYQILIHCSQSIEYITVFLMRHYLSPLSAKLLLRHMRDNYGRTFKPLS